MLTVAAIIGVSSGLGYILPALIGLESMGVPSPGETALILAAVLASQGQLNIWLVIVIAAASAIAGDNAGYFLGRHFGREVLTAHGPFHERRARIVKLGDRFFQKHGPKTVFIGRWIALFRFAIAWLAGINHMRFREFFMWNAVSGIIWALTYGLAGYYGGNAVAHIFAQAGVIAAIVLGVAIVGAMIFFKLRERRLERSLEHEAGLGAPAERREHGAASGATERARGREAGSEGAEHRREREAASDATERSREREAGSEVAGHGRGRRPGSAAAAARDFDCDPDSSSRGSAEAGPSAEQEPDLEAGLASEPEDRR